MYVIQQYNIGHKNGTTPPATSAVSPETGAEIVFREDWISGVITGYTCRKFRGISIIRLPAESRGTGTMHDTITGVRR